VTPVRACANTEQDATTAGAQWPVVSDAVVSRRAALLVLLCVVGLVGGACSSGSPKPLAVAAVPRLTTTTTVKPVEFRQVAWANVPRVQIFKNPGDATPVGTLPNPTAEDYPLAFLAIGQQPDWLQVRIPARPNSAVGWIRASDVHMGDVPKYRILVEVGAHRLSLFQGDQKLMEAPVGVGKGVTPTPTGNFYIDIKVTLSNPNGVYGPYQLSVTGFSNVLQRFAGGIGQIAIHGTNAPGLIPGNISNGCVRMRNADISKLADYGVDVGTPVDIVA